MIGIQITGGALFVEHEGVTVRVSKNGKCEVSPVLFRSLEWELRTEPPNRWDYLYEHQIQALPGCVYEQVLAVVDRVHTLLNQ